MPAPASAPPDYFSRNQAYLKPGAGQNYYTTLPATQEQAFQQWVQQNKVPFDPGPQADYDMRGFYQALQAGDPNAKSAIDPNDSRLHYPDYWKTPYHQTFSNESQWADPKTAPAWNEQDQLVAPDGTIVFDDRAQPQPQPAQQPAAQAAPDLHSQLMNLLMQARPDQQTALLQLLGQRNA